MSSLRKTSIAYAALSLLSIIIAFIYPVFGHNKYSVYLFVVCPVLAVPGAVFFFCLREWVAGEKGYRLFLNAFNFGVAAIVCGLLLSGVLDIAGGASEIVIWFFYIGALSVAFGLGDLVCIFTNHEAQRQENGRFPQNLVLSKRNTEKATGGTEMAQLKGSKTEKNLWEAFAGESQARNKYTYFASIAKKEGYEQIAAVFEETARNEKEHAELWFKELDGIGTTTENLLAAAEGEHGEWTEMYERMAKEARAEGFHVLADTFAGVAKIEKSHEERYQKLYENIESGAVFSRGEGCEWVCRNCGHIEYSMEAPDVCPVCAHPRAYFEQRAVNY